MFTFKCVVEFEQVFPDADIKVQHIMHLAL